MSDDFLADLERELVAGYRRRRHGSRPRRALRPLVTAVVLAALCVVAVRVLVAADPRERTAPPAGHRAPTHNDGYAVRSAELLPLRVGDPDGGPPWGLRKIVTRAGFTCLQFGRVVNDALGVIGVDGTARDDGAFHPLSATSARALNCERPDAGGHVFLATRHFGIARSAATRGGCRIQDQRNLSPGVPSQAPARNPCPREDVRFVSYGLLGAQARSITYLDSEGVTRTQQVVQPDGAYLVVRRPLPSDEVSGGFSPGAVPVRGSLSSIRYADGSECRLRPAFPDGASRCRARGYAQPDIRTPAPAEVSTDVRAAIRADVIHGRRLWRVT